MTFSIPKTELMLGQLAVNRGLVSRNDAKSCLDDMRRRLADGNRVLLGQVMTEHGILDEQQLEDLVAAQRRINEQREQLAWAQVGNGDMYLSMGQTAEALAEYRGVLQRFEEQREVGAVAQIRIGEALRLQGDFEGAIRANEMVFADYPDQELLRGPEARTNIAHGERMLGDTEAALAGYDRVVEQYFIYGNFCAWALLWAASLHWEEALASGDDPRAAAAGNLERVGGEFSWVDDPVPALTARMLAGDMEMDAFEDSFTHQDLVPANERWWWMGLAAEADGDTAAAHGWYGRCLGGARIKGWCTHFAQRRLEAGVDDDAN